MTRIITVERTSDGGILHQYRLTFPTLSAAVRIAHRNVWLPGAFSGTGLEIVETRFVSVEGNT